QQRDTGCWLRAVRERGGTVLADDQIAFPVTGHGAVVDLGGAFADVDHPRDPAPTLTLTSTGRSSHTPAAPPRRPPSPPGGPRRTRPVRRCLASSRRTPPRPCT